MIRVMAVLGIIVALVGASGVVSAQGLLGLPSLLGKGGDCDPANAIELYVGYASNGGMTKYTEDWPFGVIGGGAPPDYDYATTHAVYLGAGLPMKLGDALTFRLAGSVTVPATWKVEQLTPAANSMLPPEWHLRDWKGDTIWGTVEGLAGYQFGGGFSAAAGFRWDHWQTSLKEPSKERLGFGFASSDTADLTVNAYMPLVGGITNQGGFTFGVLGFPIALGDLEAHESRNTAVARYATSSGFNQGYYVEVFTEWTLPTISLLDVGSDASASLFAKFNSFEAKGRHTVTRNGIFFDTVDFAFRRNLFVIGAKGTINFSLPDLSSYF